MSVSEASPGRAPLALLLPVLLRCVCVLGFAFVLVVAGCGEAHHPPLPIGTGEVPPVPSADDMVFEVPPPPFKGDDEIEADEIFPCSECHEPDDYNATRRELTMAHQSIRLVHDTEHRWCLDCHDPENRDVLRLANGKSVPFEQSYRLCGQCHGAKYRDWRAGVHGRRIGEWNGKKEYLLCVECHDSHQPAFKPLAPLPAPVRPENLR